MRAPVDASRRLLVHRIAENWKEGSVAPYTPESMRWRGSWAGSCARQVAYKTLHVEESNPSTLAEYWNMGLGSVVHELLEPAVQKWIANSPGLTAEEEADVTFDSEGYGHVDLVLKTEEGKTIVCELKTINGFGYKQAVENHEGPKHNHLLQGSLYARALNADMLVIGYLAKELISPSRAKAKGIDDIGRFAAEWHYNQDEFMPLAIEEELRLSAITTEAHKHKDPTVIPPRFSKSDPDIPFPAEVIQPSRGRWELREVGIEGGFNVVNAGNTWQCNYCNYQERCGTDLLHAESAETYYG